MTNYKPHTKYRGHQIVALDNGCYTVLKPNGWLAAGRFETVTDVCVSIDRREAAGFKQNNQPVNHRDADTDITIGLTGPDWKPNESEKFYAQRGSGDFAFGRTEAIALTRLLLAEENKRKAAEQDYVGKLFTVTK